MWRLHFGSTLAIVFGVLFILAGFGAAQRLPEQGFDQMTGGIFMILGGVAYRSAKKRCFGAVPNTGLRRVLEVLAVFLVFYGVVGGRNLWYSNPIIFLVIPLWVIIAYAFVGFRQLPTKQPKP